MKIILELGVENKVSLSLQGGKREQGSLEWQDSNDLSHLLLSNLDKLLRKNGVGLDKILGYTIMSKVPRKWTTYRIADITLKTLNIGKLAK